MSKIVLNGITWGHSRGYTPLVAAAQCFQEMYPGVEINWKKRTLQEFADLPIEELTKGYDLLIIDHPWSGRAAATGCVLPLEEYLPPEYLEEQQSYSTGYSHLSYHYGGHQWALAIDAATPVASYRADLLEKNNTSPPDTWEDVWTMAQAGRVLLPGIPIDTLMAFYSFCLAHGEEPFLKESVVIDEAIGVKALQSMAGLWRLCSREIYSCNPIKVASLMTQTDDYWYCPFAYGYSNYARRGYAKNILTYTDLPRFGERGRLRTTLGGTGISVSASCREREWALRFAAWVVSPEIQSTLYVENGGQPGHRSAWVSGEVNRNCNDFFVKTLPALERAYVRPRYNGYLHFQDRAGLPIQQYLMNGGEPGEVLEQLNALYVASALRNG
jgi:multiple sugar transport system substrate-binding protein